MDRERHDSKSQRAIRCAVGDYVAVKMDYSDPTCELGESEQDPFWFGRVIGLLHTTSQLSIKWYHTQSKNKYTGKYRLYNKRHSVTEIPSSSIVCIVPELNPQTRTIPKQPTNYQQIIRQRLADWRDDDDDFDPSVNDRQSYQYVISDDDDDDEEEDDDDEEDEKINVTGAAVKGNKRSRSSKEARSAKKQKPKKNKEKKKKKKSTTKRK